jgi:hypothetical protein
VYRSSVGGDRGCVVVRRGGRRVPPLLVAVLEGQQEPGHVQEEHPDDRQDARGPNA